MTISLLKGVQIRSNSNKVCFWLKVASVFKNKMDYFGVHLLRHMIPIYICLYNSKLNYIIK